MSQIHRLAIVTALFTLPACTAPHRIAAIPQSQIPAKGQLCDAAYKGDLAQVKSLVASGADLNENMGSPTDHISPLLVAIASHHSEVAKFLIAQGAKLDTTFKGYTPQDYALFLDESEVAFQMNRRIQK